MNLLKSIDAFTQAHNLIPAQSTVILGLSGGPDSVFLLHVLAPLVTEGTIKLIAAHLDHGWRAESAYDVEFCRALSEKYAIPFVSAHLADLNLSLRHNGSHEEVGRKARRYFFEKLCKEYGADRIALAHHRDDQEETFFIRLIRGASLSGLTSIKPHDGMYIRPLLQTAKADIIAYLNEHTISYLIDATNASDNFLRNRLRNHALPALHATDDRFSHNFARSLHALQETENFLTDLTQKTFEIISEVDPVYGIGINKEQFLALHTVLQQRVLLMWLITTKTMCTPSQGLFEEIIRFTNNAKSTRHTLHTSWHIFKKNQCLYLTRSNP